MIAATSLFIRKDQINTSIKAPHQPQSEVKQNGRLDRIQTCVEAMFASLKNVILLPLSYLGSKTWSLPGVILRLPVVLLFGWNKKENFSEQLFGKSYHYSSKALPPEEAKLFLRNACLASSIAVASSAQQPRRMEDEWLTPFGLQVLSPDSMQVNLQGVPGQIEINDKRFLDRQSGLKMMILVNEEEAIFTFGAAGATQNEFPDAKNNPKWLALKKRIWNGVVWPNLLGASPALYKQAEALYLAVKDHPELAGKKITLVGHCLGGSLASYIGIKQEVQVNGFNTLAFGGGIQRQIGANKLRQAENYVTHLSIGKDFFSDCPNTSVIDRIVNFLGIRTPGNFGKHFTTPAYADYNKPEDGNSLSSVNQNRIHNYYVGSLMAYVGYSNRDKPTTLAQKNIDLSSLKPMIDVTEY